MEYSFSLVFADTNHAVDLIRFREPRWTPLGYGKVRAEAMLEFNTNTLAFMTAALEQACRQLKNDTPAGRQFIASKLKECAKAVRSRRRR